MTAPDISRDIVGLDVRAVRASVRVASQAGAADLARPGTARISSAGRQGRQRPTR
jgi:hypothetical protein